VRKVTRRETVLLGGLAAAGLAYLWFATQQGAGMGGGAGRGPAGTSGAPTSDAPVVRLDLLAREAEPYDPSGRDLFKYTDRPPTSEEIARLRAEAAAAKRAQENAEKLAREQAERDRIAAEERARYLAANPPPPPKPQPPPITFRYIGLLGPKEKHLAVFEEGKDIFVAGKGDVVKGQFKVLDFKYESVVLGYTRAEFVNERQELRMVTK
jgi:hypothetical protein